MADFFDILLIPANFVKLLIGAVVLALLLLIGGFTAIFTIGLDKIVAVFLLFFIVLQLPKIAKHKTINPLVATVVVVLTLVSFAILFFPNIAASFASISVQSLAGGG